MPGTMGSGNSYLSTMSSGGGHEPPSYTTPPATATAPASSPGDSHMSALAIASPANTASTTPGTPKKNYAVSKWAPPAPAPAFSPGDSHMSALAIPSPSNTASTTSGTLKKNYSKGVELRGKTLAIIGFGRIGQSVASYAIGCGMNVVATDLITTPQTIGLELGNGVTASVDITPTSDLIAAISNADFISIHVPKQPDGSAVFGTTEFAAMKQGVRIVHAARGGVINEDALIDALNSGKVAAAALDVFENEPNPRHDLLSHSKIACTPHIGAATLEAQDRIGTELAELIIAQFGVLTA